MGRNVIAKIALFLAITVASTNAAFAENDQKPIVLNWLSFSAKASVTVKNLQRVLIDRINERAKGDLVINYRGGPETIPAFDQGKAVKNGVADISAVPVGFYEALVPGVGGAMLSQISLDEERRPGGAYDYLVEMHKKGGLYYLGRGAPGHQDFFYLALNKRVEKPADFKGLKLGTATAARAAVEAWGANVVSLNMSEYYSAMERKLVDGVASVGLSSWVNQGCHEVTRYLVDNPYFASTVGVIMNLNSWNRLSPQLQKIVMDTMVEAEKELADLYEQDIKNLQSKMKTAGVEIYKLEPQVAKWFRDTAYNATWDYQMKRFPEVTPRLRELLTK